MPDDACMIYGTDADQPPGRPITLGPLTLTVVDGDLVEIGWHGVEVLRRIAYPVRDADWATMSTETLAEDVDQHAGRLRYVRRFVVGAGALHGQFVVEARADDTPTLVARLVLTAQIDLTVNRAGFIVLHPLTGVVGQPLRVIHADGTSRETRFPVLISPGQPVLDIKSLRHAVDGIEVDLDFAGDVFEMEDQRNWSDASFKTYCRPLSLPRPYALAAGETVTQDISLTLSGVLRPHGVAVPVPSLVTCPGVALAADAGDGDNAPGLRDLPVVLRCGPGLSAAQLEAFRGRTLSLEVVVPDELDPCAGLSAVARACAGAGIAPRHVVALPAAYLASHQPAGPWPGGPAPRDLIAHVRAAFPGARVGTGVLTNFTELNRCPPDAGAADFVTFSTTAIVHAADDLSVLQTLETLPHILDSARALAAGRPLRLGLVSIGMRSNPYGRAVAQNATLARTAMAGDDPRQRGLFGAAWTVGAWAAIAGRGVESLCLAMTQGTLAPGRDGHLFPIHYVIRAAADLAGQAAQRVSAEGLTGLIAQDGCGLVANLGSAALPVPRGTTHVLSTATVPAAGADPDWLQKRGQVPQTLAPFAVAFLRGAE